MNKKKESPPSGSYTKEGELLVDSAKRLADSFEPVKLMTAHLKYDYLLARLYRKNMRVK